LCFSSILFSLSRGYFSLSTGRRQSPSRRCEQPRCQGRGFVLRAALARAVGVGGHAVATEVSVACTSRLDWASRAPSGPRSKIAAQAPTGEGGNGRARSLVWIASSLRSVAMTVASPPIPSPPAAATHPQRRSRALSRPRSCPRRSRARYCRRRGYCRSRVRSACRGRIPCRPGHARG